MSRAPRPAARALLALAAVAALALLLPRLVETLAGAVLQREARAHHASVTWNRLAWRAPLSIALIGLAVSDARGATLAAAESLRVTLDPWSVITLHPRPAALVLAHARLRWKSGASADADTLPPEDETPHGRDGHPDRAPGVRAAARSLVRALLLPARRLPRLEVRDLECFTREESPLRLQFDWLSLGGPSGLARLAASGSLTTTQHMPFSFELTYGADDRLSGGARFVLAPPESDDAEALAISLSGRVTQDRHRGRVLLGDSTQVFIGRIPVRVWGFADREGPRFAFHARALGISPQECQASAPRALLGALNDLALTGTFDYAASFELDLASPDSVQVAADVTPHALALDRARTRLPITSLDAPFTAHVHLPHDRIELREMSPANPHFLPLAAIDSTLVHAVVTNEDGAFFQHRGFNLAAVRGSIADNIHAAAWRRGAGTITMQLVRNLFLGHERTLSRKAQEVVLAWVLEHLTGTGKARMLEIYLNIVEWGPASCGADEAAHYYFGHDARALAVPEALFLATVLPSPEKWRQRFASDGSLRPFERAQMHFIGRAMIRRGWLSQDRLPPADSLALELRGSARAELIGAGVAGALDSLRLSDRPPAPPPATP